MLGAACSVEEQNDEEPVSFSKVITRPHQVFKAATVPTQSKTIRSDTKKKNWLEKRDQIFLSTIVLHMTAKPLRQQVQACLPLVICKTIREMEREEKEKEKEDTHSPLQGKDDGSHVKLPDKEPCTSASSLSKPDTQEKDHKQKKHWQRLIQRTWTRPKPM